MNDRPATRPRPPLFRALGHSDPPARLLIGGRWYQRQEIFKHDSWAATALYQACTDVPPLQVVCKFHRIAPVLGLPMYWFGVMMARHEGRLLQHLAGIPAVPRLLPQVCNSQGQPLPYAVAREYIPGRPLRPGMSLKPSFFHMLRQTLELMHRRGVAYVDLHKRENIIVGNDGQPYLVDFQISWQRRTTMGSAPTFFRRGWQYLDERLFSILCQIDLYHWQKHVRRCQAVKGPRVAPPGLIRWHRWLAVPFRQWRRRLLVWCGIRSHQGAAWTERFAEDAFRFPTESSQTTRAAA